MKTFKVKATKFLSPERRKRLLYVVETIHTINQRAANLLKHHYLKTFEADPTQVIILSRDLIDNVYQVVQTGKDVSRHRKDDKILSVKIVPVKNVEEVKTKPGTKKIKNLKPPIEKKLIKVSIKVYKEYRTKHDYASIDSLLESYYDLYKDHVKCSESVSHIVSYAKDNLETEYLTNITNHYSKYVKRFVYASFFAKDTVNGMSKDAKKVLKARIGQFIKHLVGGNDNCPVDFQAWKNKHLGWLNEDYTYLEERASKNPWKSLKEMVQMTKEVEVLNVKNKLLSPFILKRSFIPGHIRIDTSGLAHLFMTTELLELFRIYYFDKSQIELKHLDKSNMLSSYEVLTNNPYASEHEKAYFATHMWRFLCKFDNSNYKEALCHTEKGVEWVFNNSIMTDGISISFTMVTKKDFSRLTSLAKASRRKENIISNEPKEPFQIFEAGIHSSSVLDPNSYILSVDPGKTNLVTFSDGKNTKSVSSSFKKTETKSLLFRSIRDKETPSIVKNFQTQVLGQTNSRSVDDKKFKEYVNVQSGYEKELQKVYSKPIFRSLKFSTFCYEKRFFDHLKQSIFDFVKQPKKEKTFKWMEKDRKLSASVWNFNNEETDNVTLKMMLKNSEKEIRDKDDILLLYGSWGKRPNLKHSAPTPGIGLKRRLAKEFRTLEVCEHNTSKVCPCCLTKSVTNHNDKHQLLRCENEKCSSRWWSRDVLGSVNILYKTLRTVVTSVFGGEGKQESFVTDENPS